MPQNIGISNPAIHLARLSFPNFNYSRSLQGTRVSAGRNPSSVPPRHVLPPAAGTRARFFARSVVWHLRWCLTRARTDSYRPTWRPFGPASATLVAHSNGQGLLRCSRKAGLTLAIWAAISVRLYPRYRYTSTRDIVRNATRDITRNSTRTIAVGPPKYATRVS